MDASFEQIAGIRLLAHQALIQNILSNWGKPCEALLQDLRRSEEALISSMLTQAITDAQINALKEEFAMAIITVTSRISDRPDDRPDPIQG